MFSFSSLLRRLFATEARLEQRARLRARFGPPCLEILEDRTLLSNSPVNVVQASIPAYTNQYQMGFGSNLGNGFAAVPGLTASVTTTAGQTVDASATLNLVNSSGNTSYGLVALVIDGNIVEQQEVTLPPTNNFGDSTAAVPLHWSLNNLSAGMHTVSVGWHPESGSPIYTDLNGTSSLTLTEYKMYPTLSVTDASGAYTGNAFSATGSAVGVESTTQVNGSWSYAYYAGPNPTGTPLSGAPTNAGTYTVVGTFTSSDGDYTGGTAQTTFTIGQATPTLSVTDAGGTYNGSAFPASATVNGGGSLEGVTPTLTYYSGTYTLNNLPTSGGSSTAPSAAGSYTVVAAFAGSADYTNASALANFTIQQAGTATALTVTAPTITYGQGVTLTATVSALPPGGGTPVGTVTFEDNEVSIGTGTLNGVVGNDQATFTTTALTTGTHSLTAIYGGDANFAGSSSHTLSTTATSTLTGVSDIYDVAIDSAGNRYVAESGPSQVAVFAPGSTTPTRFLTGVRLPTWLAFDPSGNLFVVSAFTSGLWEFAPGASTPTVTLSGLDNPQGLPVFDAKGDMFISNAGNNTVSEFAPGSTSPTPTLTGVTGPSYLACDTNGDLFVSNSGTVSEFTPGSTTPTATLTGLNGAGDLAFDAKGDLFVGSSSSTVSEYAPGSTTPMATLTGVSGPNDLDFDAFGDLFVLDSSTNTVSEFAPGSTVPTATLTGLNQAIHMALDSQGDLYVANYASSTVSEFAVSGVPLTVTPATPTVSVSDAGGTYNGQPFAATATVNGGSSLEGVTPTLTYYSGTYTPNNLPTSGGSSTAPSAAGSYTVVAAFAGGADYSSARVLANFSIGQAQAVISITGTSVTYDGNGHAASGTASGVESTPANLTSELHLAYSSDGGKTFSTSAPVNAGTYEVYYTFDGDANYQAISNETDSGQAVTIGRAQAVISFTSTSVTYDGGPHSATVTAVGVEGTPVNLIFELHPAYSSDGGKTITNSVPRNAGIYEMYYIFDGDNNYQAITTLTDSGKTLTIRQAQAVISITGASVTYEGNAHAASGTASGVENPTPANLTSELHLSYSSDGGKTFSTSAPVNAGTYEVYYTFDGDTNYQAITTETDSGQAVVIGQAALTVTANNLSKTYGQTVTFAGTEFTTTGLVGSDSVTSVTLTSSGADASAQVSNTPYPIIASAAQGTGLSNYTINYVNGGLTVNPRAVTLNGSRTYDGTTTAAASILSITNLISGDNVTLSGSAMLASANAGPETISSFAGLTLGGTAATNYTLTGASGSVNITPANTSTVLSSSANPSVVGQRVTLTASVSVQSQGAGAPTGTVTFYDGSTSLGSGTLAVVNGTDQATFSTAALSVGSHSITAAYSGNSNFDSSVSAVLSQTVNLDPTTTVLTSSASSSIYGQSVTYTATVTANAPGAGTPTGTVTFYDGSTSLGSGTLNGSGVATMTTGALPSGTDSITAAYSGDSNFLTSTSAILTHTVQPAATQTTNVSLSATSAVYGQPVMLSVTVTNTQTSARPSGNVAFYDGTTEVGITPVGAGGSATLTLSTLAVGKHSLTASYSDPAGNFAASSSPKAVSLTVTKANTTTALTATTSSPVFGQSVTFTATVTAVAPSGATPTGSVSFKDGSTTLATIALSGGSASFTTSKLAVGSHSIIAYYNGTSSFGTSNSMVYGMPVSKDGDSAVVTSSVSNPVYGQSVTLKATVTASAPGSGTPTGTVTFYDGTVSLGTATLSNGVASLKTTALSVGANSITVLYGSDSNFLSSTSAILTLTVNQDSTTTKLTSSSSTAAHGTPVTFTATVSPASPGSGTPTGTVTFTVTNSNGSVVAQETVNLSGGVAQLTYSFATKGQYKIKAVYNVDLDFLSSTSSVLTETIS